MEEIFEQSAIITLKGVIYNHWRSRHKNKLTLLISVTPKKFGDKNWSKKYKVIYLDETLEPTDFQTGDYLEVSAPFTTKIEEIRKIGNKQTVSTTLWIGQSKPKSHMDMNMGDGYSNKSGYNNEREY